ILGQPAATGDRQRIGGTRFRKSNPPRTRVVTCCVRGGNPNLAGAPQGVREQLKESLMKYSACYGTSIGRVAIAGTALALAIGSASAAFADVAANQKCRKGVGSQLSSVIKKGMQSQEKCYKGAGKAAVSGEICTMPD